tara:strand:+ start:1062 stop:1499 length:438 start_codon:yes stop_codon:yes gene_type:complete
MDSKTFCATVAAKVTGASFDDVKAATSAVDQHIENGGDEPGYSARDLSGSVDIIFQLIKFLLEAFEDCDRSRLARTSKRRRRRTRNVVESRAREFCSSCSTQRFGRWAREPELLAESVLEQTSSMEETDIVNLSQDFDSDEYDHI